MAKLGKRLKGAYESVDPLKLHALDEAVKLVKSGATAKFDETVEIPMNLGVDPRHADQMVRGVVLCRTARARQCASLSLRKTRRLTKPAKPVPKSSVRMT